MANFFHGTSVETERQAALRKEREQDLKAFLASQAQQNPRLRKNKDPPPDPYSRNKTILQNADNHPHTTQPFLPQQQTSISSTFNPTSGNPIPFQQAQFTQNQPYPFSSPSTLPTSSCTYTPNVLYPTSTWPTQQASMYHYAPPTGNPPLPPSFYSQPCMQPLVYPTATYPGWSIPPSNPPPHPSSFPTQNANPPSTSQYSTTPDLLSKVHSQQQYAEVLKQQVQEREMKKQFDKAERLGTSQSKAANLPLPVYFGDNQNKYALSSQNRDQDHFVERNDESDIKQKQREAQIKYQRELEIQIKDKKDREAQVRRKQDLEDRKIISEVYDPWGKSGGGAPIRDNAGHAITNLSYLKHGAKVVEEHPTAVEVESKAPGFQLKDIELDQDFMLTLQKMNIPSLPEKRDHYKEREKIQVAEINSIPEERDEGERRFLRGVVDITKLPEWEKREYAQKVRDQEEIQHALKEQIVEKEKKKAEEERKRQQEDEQLENKLKREQEILQERYKLEIQRQREEEEKKEHEKNKVKNIANNVDTATPREDDAIRRKAEEEALRRKNKKPKEQIVQMEISPQLKQDNDAPYIEFRSNSPPVPAIAKKLPIVNDDNKKSKASAIEEGQLQASPSFSKETPKPNTIHSEEEDRSYDYESLEKDSNHEKKEITAESNESQIVLEQLAKLKQELAMEHDEVEKEINLSVNRNFKSKKKLHETKIQPSASVKGPEIINFRERDNILDELNLKTQLSIMEKKRGILEKQKEDLAKLRSTDVKGMKEIHRPSSRIEDKLTRDRFRDQKLVADSKLIFINDTISRDEKHSNLTSIYHPTSMGMQLASPSRKQRQRNQSLTEVISSILTRPSSTVSGEEKQTSQDEETTTTTHSTMSGQGTEGSTDFPFEDMDAVNARRTRRIRELMDTRESSTMSEKEKIKDRENVIMNFIHQTMGKLSTRHKETKKKKKKKMLPNVPTELGFPGQEVYQDETSFLSAH